jgi:hypothetical protein
MAGILSVRAAVIQVKTGTVEESSAAAGDGKATCDSPVARFRGTSKKRLMLQGLKVYG